MDRQPIAHPDCDSLQSVLKSIALWITKYRYKRDTCNDLANCGPEEVANIARDLRLSPSELAILARKGPNVADLLQDMLNALGLDKNILENDKLLVMRDLERLCTTCREKRQCRFDFANGVIADNFRDYCPNAFTLDALLQEKEQRAKEQRA
jgi:hypothetical protein